MITDEDPMAFEFEINTEGFNKRMKRAAEKGLLRCAEYTAQRWKSLLKAWNLELYGIAISSIRVEVITPSRIIVRSDETAPYLKYHEYGAGPSHEPNPHPRYYPSKMAIRNWVIAKGLHWTDDSGKPLTVDQMTFLIIRKQHKVGLYPKPAARPAYEDGRLHLRKFINDAMCQEFGIKK